MSNPKFIGERWRAGTATVPARPPAQPVPQAPGYAHRLGLELHHLVVPSTFSPAALTGTARSVYDYHVHTKKWRDIWYGFVVGMDGSVAIGRGWLGRTTTARREAVTIGFACNSDNTPVTQLAVASAKWLIVLGLLAGVPENLTTHGMRDATNCPGASIQAAYRAGRFNV